jgi:hypothetical protein
VLKGCEWGAERTLRPEACTAKGASEAIAANGSDGRAEALMSDSSSCFDVRYLIAIRPFEVVNGEVEFQPLL